MGIDHDHVSKIIGHHTYWRNRKEETIALWEGRRDEVVESQKNNCVELMEKLDYDIITVGMVPPKGYVHPNPPKKIGEGVWEDSKGRIYKYAASNDSIVCMDHSPGREYVSEEDIQKAFEKLDNIDESRFELIDYIGNKYGDEKVVLFRGINIYGALMSIFGGDRQHELVLPLIAPDGLRRCMNMPLSIIKS